jgi:hypothetical protein
MSSTDNPLVSSVRRIRDGEKLHEELFDDNETRETTDIPGIQLARSQVESLPRMRHLRDQILQSGSSGDTQAMIAMLREVLSQGSHEAFAGVAANVRDAEQAVELDRLDQRCESIANDQQPEDAVA